MTNLRILVKRDGERVVQINHGAALSHRLNDMGVVHRDGLCEVWRDLPIVHEPEEKSFERAIEEALSLLPDEIKKERKSVV